MAQKRSAKNRWIREDDWAGPTAVTLKGFKPPHSEKPKLEAKTKPEIPLVRKIPEIRPLKKDPLSKASEKKLTTKKLLANRKVAAKKKAVAKQVITNARSEALAHKTLMKEAIMREVAAKKIVVKKVIAEKVLTRKATTKEAIMKEVVAKKTAIKKAAEKVVKKATPKLSRDPGLYTQAVKELANHKNVVSVVEAHGRAVEAIQNVMTPIKSNQAGKRGFVRFSTMEENFFADGDKLETLVDEEPAIDTTKPKWWRRSK